jgi:hypothetical protein
MREQWRQIPNGLGCKFSSLGRLQNIRGYILTPFLQKGIQDPRKQAVYVVKRHRITKRFYPYHLMSEIFPAVHAPEFDAAWADTVRAMNQESRQQQPKPENTGQGKTSLAASLPKYSGWDHDPWDKMHLWDREHDYFSAAQYCPCL